MVSYRAYFLAQDGSTIGFQLLEAGDDHHALALAGRITATCSAIEVWATTRLVGRVDASLLRFEGIDVTDAYSVVLAARAAQQQADMMEREREWVKIRVAKFKLVMAERAQ